MNPIIKISSGMGKCKVEIDNSQTWKLRYEVVQSTRCSSWNETIELVAFPFWKGCTWVWVWRVCSQFFRWTGSWFVHIFSGCSWQCPLNGSYSPVKWWTQIPYCPGYKYASQWPWHATQSYSILDEPISVRSFARCGLLQIFSLSFWNSRNTFGNPLYSSRRLWLAFISRSCNGSFCRGRLELVASTLSKNFQGHKEIWWCSITLIEKNNKEERNVKSGQPCAQRDGLP